MEIVRVLRWYDKSEEHLVDECTLKGISVHELQIIFCEDEENPMYDCYSVETKQACEIKKYCDVEFNFSKYDYFVESYSI